MGRKAATAAAVLPEIEAVFDAAQRSTANHSKGVVSLQALRKSVGTEKFNEQLIGMVNFLLPVFRREPAVERCVDFVVRFASTPDAGEPSATDFDAEVPSDVTLNALIGHFLSVAGAKDKAVRFRACQFISKIFNGLDEEAEVDGDLCDAVLDDMLVRTTDKIPAVRVQAINALSRLQDATDADCKIIASYLRRMETDSSPEVRRAALHQVAVSKATLPAIVRRTRDGKDVVRKHAFKMIGDKVDVAALSIESRMRLLEGGLKDRTPAVRDACIDMMCNSWFGSCDHNVVKLLGCLDVEAETETCERALLALLGRIGGRDLVAKDFEVLECESALWWRVASQRFQGDADMMEQLLPSASTFAETVQKYAELEADASSLEERLQMQFIARQLMTIAALLDYSDEVGRRNMATVARELLVVPGVPLEFVEPLVHLLAVLFPDEADRVRVVSEIVADVRMPMITTAKALNKQERRQRELKLASVRVDLMTAQDKKEELVKAEQYAEAEEVKQLISELEKLKAELSSAPAEAASVERVVKDDPATWLTCLTIVRDMLATTKLPLSNSHLGGLVASLVVPGVQNADPNVRNMAVRALGLCALLNKDFARTHVLLFLQVVQVDQEVLQQSALEVLFDLVLVHGLSAFQDQDEAAVEANPDAEEHNLVGEVPAARKPSVLTVLQTYLDSENGDLRTIAVEGFARLMLLDHLASAQVFSHLVLLFFNPTTEEDTRLRQCLSIFFPAFAFSRRAHQELIEEAFFPTLRTVLQAPRSSPLYPVKPADVAEFLVCLTGKDASQASSSLGVHESLAISIANEILSHPKGEGAKALCKALNLMHMAGFSALNIKSLRVLGTQLTKTVKDRVCLKHINAFNEKLVLLDETPTEGLSEAQLEQLRADTLRHLEEAQPTDTARDEAAEFGVEDTDIAPATDRTTRSRARTAARKPVVVEESEAESEEEDLSQEEEAEEEEEEEEFAVEKILDCRKKRGGKREFFIKWEGYPSSDNTWEAEANIATGLVSKWDAAHATSEPAEKENTKQAAKRGKGRGRGKKAAAEPVDDLLLSEDEAAAKPSTAGRVLQEIDCLLAE